MSQSICIDFGSTFTKVAVRADWNAPAALASFPEYSKQPDGSICVPSIVCESRRSRTPQWYFGKEAAELQPAEDIIIHANWKSHFVTPQDDPNSDLLTAAGKFFGWLRAFCSKHEATKEYIDAPCRLCVPDFDRLGKWKKWLRSILSTAGWNCKEDCLLTEPHANLIGALTCGRNEVWVPPKSISKKLQIRFMRMFDVNSGVLGRAREVILHGRNADYSALIIDVGAYTTDCGMVTWKNVAGLDFNPNEVVTKSDVCGVQNLDDLLRRTFRKEYGDAINAMSFSAFEKMKRSLLAGDEYAISVGTKRHVLGSSEHKEAVDSCVRDFSQRVVSVVNSFLQSGARKRVDTVVLTGGGTVIPGVRSCLKDRFASEGSQFVDLADESLIFNKLDESLNLTHDARLRRNKLLVRGASAVGGASVYFDAKAGTFEIAD